MLKMKSLVQTYLLQLWKVKWDSFISSVAIAILHTPNFCTSFFRCQKSIPVLILSLESRNAHFVNGCFK